MSTIYRVRWHEAWRRCYVFGPFVVVFPVRQRDRERIFTDETTAARQIDNVARGGNVAVLTTLTSVESAGRERFTKIDPETLRRAAPNEEREYA